MATPQQQYQQAIDEVKELIKKTGSTAIDPINIKNLQQAKDAVKLLSAELRDMSTDLDYINESFKDTLNELSKQNIYLNTAKSSLRGISSISSQILEHKKGESTLDVSQLIKLKQKAKLQFEEIQLATKKGNLSDKEKEALQTSLKARGDFNDELDRALEVEQKVNREIGLAGVALKGFANLMSKAGLGDLSKPFADAIDKTKDARRQIQFYNDAIKELENKANRSTEEEEVLKFHKNQVKELSTQTNKYKNILSSLKEQLTMTNLVDGAITKIVSEYFNVNKAAVEYTRLTGQNATATAGLNSNLATSAQVLTLMAELTKQTGIAAGAIFSADDLGRLAEAQNLLGLSAEQAGNLGVRSKLAGKSIEDYEKGIVKTTNNYNKLNNNAISHGVVMQDVLNVSDDIALSLGNSDTAITKAAASARGLGLSLEKVDQIASSLMDFETSIGYELEAQLLTGKNINLSKAREYALTNDLAGLSEELKKNGASAAEFANMGRIEQEGLAKALGMSRGELAKSVMMQETAKNLTDEQRANAMGVTIDQMKQMEIQQKIEQSLAKLAQAFAPILDAMIPIVEAIISVIGPVAKMVASLSSGIAPFIKYLGVAYGIMKGMQLTLGVISAIQTRYTASKVIELGIGGKILTMLGFQNAIAGYQLAREEKMNIFRAIGVALEETKLGSIIAQGYNLIKNVGQYIVTNALAAGRAIMESTILGSIIAQGYNLIKNVGQYIVKNALAAKEYIMEQGKVGFKAAQVGLEATLTSIKQRGLLITLREAGASIAKAAMGAITSLSSIPVVGWALGLAAAGTVAALGYSLLKADDAISPGYGKRTMMSPEGAIQFNDKDTIVAGTNLFGGEDQQQTESVSSVINISPLVEEMQGLRAEVASLIQVIKQGGDIYMDTNKVGKALRLGNFSI